MSTLPPSGPGVHEPAALALHERLHEALPTSLPGLDLDATLVRGRRTVRRRRVGAALVAAVAVAAVAVGSGVLAGGRPVSAPAPAGPTSGGAHTGGTAGESGSATLTVSATSSSADPGLHTYVVSLAPAGDHDLLVSYGEQTTSGLQQLGGSGVSSLDRRITWGHGGSSPVVIGLVPSATALDRLIVTTDSDYGGYATSVAPVTGTDWSAFVVYFDKPVAGPDPVQQILWFDSSGRPVDRDGRVGEVASVSGTRVWVTADGLELGNDFASTSAVGALPTLVTGGDAGVATQSWRVVALAPAGAVSGTLHLGSGAAVPFTTVPLSAAHTVLAVEVDGTKNVSPTVTSMTWVDAAGATHQQGR